MALTGQRVRLALGLLLVALNLALVNALAARYPLRGDWTRAGVTRLSERTVQVLRGIRRPVRAVLFMVPPERLQESVYHETLEVLRRFADYAPLLRLEQVDMDADPTRAEVLARTYGITEADLRGGVVVLARGPKVRHVRAAALAEYERAGEGRRLAAYTGEGQLLAALLEVLRDGQETVCFTSGHGEAPSGSYAEAGYGYLADEVRREAYAVRELAPDGLGGDLAACRVVVVGGPSQAFAPVEVDALERYLGGGGRLFVLLGPVLDRRGTRHLRTGLEPLLARYGAAVEERIVVDPLAVPGEQALLTWATREGYGDHPAARALHGRVTVWPLARALEATGRAEALVLSSERGWAEADLSSLRGERALSMDVATDRPGPVPVAVAAERGKARLVVWGSERGVLNRRLGQPEQRDYNADLFLSSLAWLAGQREAPAIGPKTPEHLRLTLDESQLTRAFLTCVVALPAVALAAALWVFFRRRR